MDAAGQAITGGVLPLDGLLQGLRMHDAEHWAEALVDVEPGTGAHVIADTRRPQGAFLVELLWLHQPLFTRLQLGQAAQQLLARGFGEAVHRRGDLIAGAGDEGLDGVDKLGAQALRLAGRTDEDNQEDAEHFCPEWPKAER